MLIVDAGPLATACSSVQPAIVPMPHEASPAT
jgi:hypothetical protein